jgi:HEAT repeat protein
VTDLAEIETDKGTWMVYYLEQKGQLTAKLLPEIVNQSLAKLPIPKRMRWGASDVEFPGYATRGLKREDIPFSAYAVTVPLWRALPTSENKDGVRGSMVRVRFPDGTLVPADDVASMWRKKDKKIVDELYTYLKAPETYTIITVAKLLPAWRVPYAEKVIPLLGHPSKSVQNTALEILESERDDTRVLEAVRAYLKGQKDMAQAVAAAKFLGKAKDKTFSIEEQFFYLTRGSDKQAIDSAKALGALKDDRIVALLEDKLTAKTKPLAVAAAGAIEAQDATATQTKALKNSKIDASIRLMIAEALTDNSDDLKLIGYEYLVANGGLDTKLDAVKALGNLKTESARKALEGYLGEKNEFVRQQSAKELEQRAEPESVDAFAKAMKGGPDQSLMEETGYRVMLAQPLNVIEEKTTARDTQVQRLAYRALGEKAKSSKVFGILKKGLSDRNSAIRGAAARAIGAFANKDAASALETVADDRSADVRRDVALALGNFKNGEMVEQLKKYLEDKESGVVAGAIDALAQRKEAFAWDTIKQQTKSKEPQVRAAALKALAALVGRGDKQGVREVISLLSGAISDSSTEVKVAAMEALGTFKDDRAVTSIAVNASNEDLALRLAALEALGKSGHPSAREVLVTALSDEEITAREQAVKSLGTLGDAAAKSALKDFAEREKDQDLKSLAESVMKKL